MGWWSYSASRHEEGKNTNSLYEGKIYARITNITQRTSVMVRDYSCNSVTFGRSSSVSLLCQDMLRFNEQRCSSRTFKVLSFSVYHEWAPSGEVRDKLIFSVYWVRFSFLWLVCHAVVADCREIDLFSLSFQTTWWLYSRELFLSFIVPFTWMPITSSRYYFLSEVWIDRLSMPSIDATNSYSHNYT